MSRLPLVVLATVIALICSTRPAHAVVVSYTSSITSQSTPLSGTLLQVDRFNPALGTLTSVNVTLSGSLTASALVRDSATGGTQNGTYKAVVDSFFGQRALGAPASLPASQTVLAPGATIVSLTKTFFPPEPDTVLNGTASSGTLTLLSSTTPSTLLQFTGTSKFGYEINAGSAIFSKSGASNVNFVSGSQATAASALLTVTYNYTAVPEASAWLMGGVGLSLAGLIRFAGRRRQC